LFIRADEGNTTVALDKDAYINKINKILLDEDTYIKINKNPIKKINDNLHSLFKKWKNSEYTVT